MPASSSLLIVIMNVCETESDFFEMHSWLNILRYIMILLNIAVGKCNIFHFYLVRDLYSWIEKQSERSLFSEPERDSR